MGKILSQLVITGLERCGQPKVIQLGNCEQVIVIQGINAAGQVIPPFIIFVGQYYLSTQYQEDILYNQAISVSGNGWTTNKLKVDQLKHFNTHIKDYTVGAYCLLIINGYKSHNLFKFQEICKENNIITLYMPPHLLYLLQPLDIGCFLLLKKAYRSQIRSLIHSHINYITKLKFLLAFKAAFKQSITKKISIQAFKAQAQYHLTQIQYY